MPMGSGGRTATYIYQISTGTLLAWGPDSANLVVATSDQMTAAGLAFVSGLLPLVTGVNAWDTTQKTVVSVTGTTITTTQFILLFTAAETAAIAASPDPQVQQYLKALNVTQSVSLIDPVVSGGVNYLVSIGLLTAQRAGQILSGQQVKGP